MKPFSKQEVKCTVFGPCVTFLLYCAIVVRCIAHVWYMLMRAAKTPSIQNASEQPWEKWVSLLKMSNVTSCQCGYNNRLLDISDLFVCFVFWVAVTDLGLLGTHSVNTYMCIYIHTYV